MSFICVLKLKNENKVRISGFGGLGVACWPLVPKSDGFGRVAEAVGLPSEGK
jgi:hypothetical protein